MKDKLFPTTYFGPISWYSRLMRAGEWRIDTEERYVKQTTRNHCLIAAVNGVQKLTVPVVKASLTSDVLLSDHGQWRSEHWNALCSAYGESPFFDYYADDLRPFFEHRDWERLIDFNQAITEKMLELLGPIPPRKEDDHTAWQPKPYWQVYQQRHGFLPDLSILDLLCCMGNEAVFYL